MTGDIVEDLQLGQKVKNLKKLFCLSFTDDVHFILVWTRDEL